MPDPLSHPLPPLREVIARHGLSARKSLSQNFLLDLNLTGRIAREALIQTDPSRGCVIEIGPGPGGLTRALLAQGVARVIAVERDVRCLAALAELAQAYPGRLEIIAGDALDFDAASAGLAPRRIVANLPYNIATPLLFGWLNRIEAFESLTVMFQKEVAVRLTAQPGGRTYGRLSIAAQWRCTVQALFDVPARAFTPPPKVTSTVVELRPRPTPIAEADPALLEQVTAAAFGQRRKMLRASLKSLGVDPLVLLHHAQLPETARAEEITITGFCALARALAELRI